jgi:DNA-binding CsgD family transcriptional regulator
MFTYFILMNYPINTLIIAFVATLCFTLTMLGYPLYRSWNKVCREKNQALHKQIAMEFQISLAEKYIQKEKARQRDLEQELEFKDKQLTSYALSFEQKNRIIEQLQEIVKKIERTNSNPEKLRYVKELKQVAKDNLLADKNWECFRDFFQETQQGFHSKLLSKHPELKPNDLKLCSVIRLNLSIKEAAQVLGISPGSLKTSRYRLRKKLDLDSKREIIDYLLHLENEEIFTGTSLESV